MDASGDYVKLCGIKPCREPSCGGWVEVDSQVDELGGTVRVRVEVCLGHLETLAERWPREFVAA